MISTLIEVQPPASLFSMLQQLVFQEEGLDGKPVKPVFGRLRAGHRCFNQKLTDFWR